ncbi:hypothetical protein DPMN_163799 [Dreissena polymorpha]|uniref:BHLH domain-containing protein n=1 Tax=Dreissena polymorpha TaxID=45954 RepID=A0A9D4EXG6_DREPO|nr:hypothetical protein DPMN_163796 [Dreissena polymorpha]KAH3785705.1 hypothetical protein DPMN_163799 [Dreissena polymorpha]
MGTQQHHSHHVFLFSQIRKPLVEKQRRERMNHSIDKLKRLIADTVREQVTHGVNVLLLFRTCY